jgi:hypothetical protein
VVGTHRDADANARPDNYAGAHADTYARRDTGANAVSGPDADANPYA